ncbi:hypothetical protein [Mycobacterium marinum]|nr:hypothetical protein [Mycobacterium marinum]
MPRDVRSKGGSTRHVPAKRLKVCSGRVSLCQNGKTERFHVRQLFAAAYPELDERPNTRCHNGHVIHLPKAGLPAVFACRVATRKVRVWGTGNRICLRCSDPPEVFTDDNLYSLAYGAAGAGEYTGQPACPKLRNGGIPSHVYEEIDWALNGFSIIDP